MSRINRFFSSQAFILVVIALLVLCFGWPLADQYFGKAVLSSAHEQVDVLLERANQYSQQGERLTAVKLKLIGSFLKDMDRDVQEPSNRIKDDLLSVEIFAVTTGAYPSEYKKAELAIGEELSNIGEPLMTLLILQIEQLASRDSLSEVEGGGACTALRSLTFSSRERATVLLNNILEIGENNVIVWESCIVAWRIKLPHLEELLDKIVSKSKGWGRQYSIFVLGEIGAYNSLPKIIEALSDTSVAVRRHSVLAISKVGDGSALPELRRLRDTDSDEVVRSLAAKTILKIEKGLSSLEPGSQ